MNRNTILYILVALLVVGGITWLVVANPAEEAVDGDDTEQVDSDDTTDETDENEDTDADQTDQKDDTNDTQSGEPEDTNTGVSTGNGSGGTGQTTPPVGGSGEADVVGAGDSTAVTDGGTQLNEQEIRERLTTHVDLLESLVRVVALELEAGNITPAEASDLLEDLELATDNLEEVIDQFNEKL